MFLASAFGFETGPYSEGNIVLQPVIGCGPCNPNKPCARPDCHDTIDPSLVAFLAMERVKGEVREVAPDIADPRQVVVYRSVFDANGFCDLVPINGKNTDPYAKYRDAYRKLWLDDLGGLQSSEQTRSTRLVVVEDEIFEGLKGVSAAAARGQKLISELVRLVKDVSAPAAELGRVNTQLSELDRDIEQLGFHYGPLGPLTRMFVFAKENLQGTEALGLASQMNRVYQDLERRCGKLGRYCSGGTLAYLPACCGPTTRKRLYHTGADAAGAVGAGLE
jgi:hypothetical protein